MRHRPDVCCLVLTVYNNILCSLCFKRIAMNCSDFEYPIKLEGVNCLRSDFLTCGSESTTVCCKELLKPDSAGPQEVHNIMHISSTVWYSLYMLASVVAVCRNAQSRKPQLPIEAC
jgi:hypothetical protein